MQLQQSNLTTDRMQKKKINLNSALVHFQACILVPEMPLLKVDIYTPNFSLFQTQCQNVSTRRNDFQIHCQPGPCANIRDLLKQQTFFIRSSRKGTGVKKWSVLNVFSCQFLRVSKLLPPGLLVLQNVYMKRFVNAKTL